MLKDWWHATRSVIISQLSITILLYLSVFAEMLRFNLRNRFYPSIAGRVALERSYLFGNLINFFYYVVESEEYPQINDGKTVSFVTNLDLAQFSYIFIFNHIFYPFMLCISPSHVIKACKGVNHNMNTKYIR